MKNILKTFALAFAISAALQAYAMPIGLRTAAWGVAASTGRASVALALPDTVDSVVIQESLVAFSDKKIEANIEDASDYEAFREWALESGARADVLKSSPTAWFSFATGSPVLVAEPEDGDLAIDEVSVSGADGEMELVISLEDVTIDSQALESRLKSVFGVVGGTSLDETGFSEDNLELSLVPTGDGRLRATVVPKKDALGKAPHEFFMRTKLK